jgi:penicillin-binding protein 1C
MQEGLIAEKTILYDIPKNYAGYQPQNYSQSFLGPVTAREALTESLNVVAVDLSNRLGLEKLHRLLQEGGISTLDKPAGYYGLPLVLGGVEVRLVDLTNLYSSLANRGEYRPYRLLLDESEPAPAKRILSAEAAWLITHILTDVERPDFPSSWQFSKSRPTIAWKTGTSYGHQDAWSVGYTTRHTIGVWVGNFDGRPATSLAGSKAAGPLLFDLFQSIEDMNDPRWFQKPERVKTRQVCSVCGLPPNRHCRNFVREYYIEGVEGPATEGICEIPQLISIDIRTNQQATAATPAEYVRQRVFNVWPSAIAGFLLNHGVPVHNVPPYNPEYMAGQKYYPPTILAPAENATVYWRLDKLQQSDHGVKLQAGVTNRVRKIFWFLNDKLLAAVDPKETVLINPPPGEYKLELIDDIGGTDSMTLTVKDYREQLQHEKI